MSCGITYDESNAMSRGRTRDCCAATGSFNRSSRCRWIRVTLYTVGIPGEQQCTRTASAVSLSNQSQRRTWNFRVWSESEIHIESKHSSSNRVRNTGAVEAALNGSMLQTVRGNEWIDNEIVRDCQTRLTDTHNIKPDSKQSNVATQCGRWSGRRKDGL